MNIWGKAGSRERYGTGGRTGLEARRTTKRSADRGAGSEARALTALDDSYGFVRMDADSVSVAEEEYLQRRRRERRERQRQRRARQVRRQKRAAVLAAVFAVVFFIVGTQAVMSVYAKSKISGAVRSYRKTVEKYAKQEGISDRVDILLAIMMVESAGKGQDVMQSSESKGLPINSLGPEESIEQACVYYAALVKIAKGMGIKDEKALIQSYNFGPGYLDFISARGKKHTQKLATAYAKKMSGDQKVRYLNLYAIRKNGGWLYSFGNMFYVKLVEKYL